MTAVMPADPDSPPPSSSPAGPATSAARATVLPGELEGPVGPPPSSAGAAVAVVLLIVVVILAALMVTGINDQIPYLHPASADQVTVFGDRVTYAYEFVGNGTLSNSTAGYICSQCPLSMTTGAHFAIDLTVVNPNNSSEDITRISAAAPFSLVNVSPGSATTIAAGLSQAYALTVQAPPTTGSYVLPLTVNINVS